MSDPKKTKISEKGGQADKVGDQPAGELEALSQTQYLEDPPDDSSTSVEAGKAPRKGKKAKQRKTVEPGMPLDGFLAEIDRDMQGALATEYDQAPADFRNLAAMEKRFLIFTLAGTRYAVPITNVSEVGRVPTITSIPNVPDWILGVTNLRGDILSVVDFCEFFALPASLTGAERQMVVLHTDNGEVDAAFIVDRVNGIRPLPAEQLSRSELPAQGKVAPHVHEIYKYEEKVLVVLAIDALLLSDEFREIGK